MPRPREWPARQHGDGLSTLVSVVEIIKNLKVTNLENMAHATVQRYDVLTKIL